MNQNDLDALREIAKAEQILMTDQDYIKALEHLGRARKLSPGIDNLESLTAACEILLGAREEITGCGVNHYWVLGVHLSSSVAEVRSRYQKLANLLQPIKQTYGFAGTAFTLLGNALAVLTDVNRRTQFDLKRKKCLKSCEMPSLGVKEEDVAAGQIWAVYGGGTKDYYPTEYVRFDKMVSGTELAAVTYLEPAGVLDHEVKAAREKLPVSCGIFRISERSGRMDLKRFSYRVEYQQTRMCYKIYPQKGEIWAMYKGWSMKWGVSDYERSECFIVQVDSGLTESGDGIVVSKLEEVKGCVTFFCHRDMSRDIPRASMLCFSHRIPAFKVPGIQRFGIPEESWHLEPNALPLS